MSVRDQVVTADSDEFEPNRYRQLAGGADLVDEKRGAGHRISFADSPYTLRRDDYLVLADTSAGPIIVNVPDAREETERIYVVKKITTDTNTITLTAAAGNTIEAGATHVYGGTGGRDSRTIQAEAEPNDTNWWVV